DHDEVPMWLLRVAPPYFYNRRASMFKPPCNAKPLIINVRFGSLADINASAEKGPLSGVKQT
ncbi:MAG: hypothetical protein O7A64_01280, partial [Alphaproteobacteria bacterium]|nr:hypothetical protein [Alphaproteobacteria bacterium]